MSDPLRPRYVGDSGEYHNNGKSRHCLIFPNEGVVADAGVVLSAANELETKQLFYRDFSNIEEFYSELIWLILEKDYTIVNGKIPKVLYRMVVKDKQ